MSVKAQVNQRHLVIIAIGFLMLSFIANTLYLQSQVTKNIQNRLNIYNTYRIFENIKDNEQVGQLLQIQCDHITIEQCQTSVQGVKLSSLTSDKRDIDFIAGNEKSLVTYSLANNLSQLLVAIEAMHAGQVDRKPVIIEKINEIQDSFASLVLINSQQLQKSHNNFYTVTAFILIFLALFIYRIVSRISDRAEKENRLLLGYKNDIEVIKSVLNNSEVPNYSKNEQSEVSESSHVILQKIALLSNDIAEKENSINLFNLVNKSINYEFRNITNTLTGGVKILSSALEGQHVILANEVLQSAQVLEELADNFWSLFEEQADINILNTNQFVDKLLSLFRSRAEKNNQQIECLVTSYVPTSIYLSEVKLLWGVYLESMRLMDLYRGKSLFIVIDSEPTVSIDRARLSFNLYFLGCLDQKASTLQEQTWHLEEESQSYFMRIIFNDFVYPSISRYTFNDDVLVKIQLDVEPEGSIKQAALLEGRHILVCGSNALQTDILNNIITQAGAKVEILTSPSEMFQCLSKDKTFQAIILTDTLSGVDFNSFLKTLQLRVKKVNESCKLFLSVMNKNLEADVADYVDKIIHRPSSSQYLVKNLLEYMEAVEDEEESNTDTIVVIDDDDAHGFILSEILMESGWEVEVFDNAYEGMEYIFEHQTKMAFIDCIMPEITGFEAAQKIRIKEKELAISPMTIFAATGLTSASEMNQCISSGMDYVIQKPYNQAEILKVMKTYMAARKVY